MMQKHFVKFFAPGAFVGDSWEWPIGSWDVEEAKAQATPRVAAFQFKTRGRGDNDLDSREIAASGLYYIGGRVETLEEIKARGNPNDQTLIANMEDNGWPRVVVTRTGWTRPFNEGDQIV